MNLIRGAYQLVDQNVLLPTSNFLGMAWDGYTDVTKGVADRIVPITGRNPSMLRTTVNKIIRIALTALPVVAAHFALSLGYTTLYGIRVTVLTVAAYALYTYSSRSNRIKTMDESIAVACTAEVVAMLAKSIYTTLTTGVAMTLATPIRGACISIALAAYFANRAVKADDRKTSIN